MNDLDERVIKVLEGEGSVLVGYVYGSVVRGAATHLSDVDVAVLLRDDADLPQAQLDLIAALSSALSPARVEVVVLNEAPPALAYHVLRDGRLILSRDERARIRHWTLTVDRYLDMEPMRRALDKGTSNRLAEGRFGRP